MQYLCEKQIPFGGKTYHPGEIIPDGVVLPERSLKLQRSGHISKIEAEPAAELRATEPGAFEGTVQISVRGESEGENEQITAIPATPEEIQQVFSIMQLNAEDGAKAIAEVKDENVLILLHAADSRKTIKDAAKKQADNLFSTNGVLNESSKGNETTGTNTEGADT